MSERPIGPESFVVLWRLLKTKSVVSRQRERRSAISVGERLVLLLSSLSFCSRSFIMAMQSAIGTEGKRASASYENILVPGGSLRSLIFLTNSTEFLQMYFDFWM